MIWTGPARGIDCRPTDLSCALTQKRSSSCSLVASIWAGEGFGSRKEDLSRGKSIKQKNVHRTASKRHLLPVRDNGVKGEHIPSTKPAAGAELLGKRMRELVIKGYDGSGKYTTGQNAKKVQGALLVGFTKQDAEQVQAWLAAIEGGLVIACCWDEHLGRTVEDLFSIPHGAIPSDCPWKEAIEPVPRAVIFSGMSQKEMLGIAEFWNLSGVQEPIFGSSVPAVQRRQLRDVLREMVDACAQNEDSSQANLDTASLKDLLRKKIAARSPP